ncbi:MAG: lytic murein transglycosylase, partial [Plesiomonas shigelloides]
MRRTILSVMALSLILSGCAATTAAENTAQQRAPATTHAGKANSSSAEQMPVPEGFAPFIEQLKQQAIAEGLAPETVERGFADVYFLERAVQSDRGQPEFKLTLSQYLQKSLTPAKIKKAREMYQQYQL